MVFLDDLAKALKAFMARLEFLVALRPRNPYYRNNLKIFQIPEF